jgi:tetratricopeptide (TPR) repeat protein
MTGAVPNTKLIDVMRRSGLSASGLARRVVDVAAQHGVERNYTHIDVKRWTEGRQPRGMVPAFIAQVLAAKLGRPVSVADIGMTGSTDAVLARANEYPQTVAEAAAALMAVVKADQPDVATAGVESVDSSVWADLMVQWLLAPDGKGPRLVEPVTQDARGLQLAGDMFSRLDYQFGGGYARTALVEFIRSELAPLVNDPRSRAPEVMQAAAALLRLAGWTAYDTGAHDLATRYLTQALRLAQAAGDRALGGRILAGLSHQANFLGYHEHAANLARAAQRGAQGQATPTAMALFYAMEARALAGSGDRRGTEAALLAAESWFERRSPQNDPTWLRYFDRAELAAEFAHSYRDLGMADKAIEFGEIAVYEAEPLYVRSIAFCQCVLAAGHLGNGDLEQGLHLAESAVTAAGALRSVRSREYVRDFLGRLTPYRGQLLVADFVSRVERTFVA